jgi:hypothetical protein
MNLAATTGVLLPYVILVLWILFRIVRRFMWLGS